MRPHGPATLLLAALLTLWGAVAPHACPRTNTAAASVAHCPAGSHSEPQGAPDSGTGQKGSALCAMACGSAALPGAAPPACAIAPLASLSGLIAHAELPLFAQAPDHIPLA